MKKQIIKRIISLLLVFALMLNLPFTALASVKDLMGNTGAENSAILKELAALTGGSGEEAYALLKSLGLLDQGGNLNVDQSIELDGKSMKLDEVMALLDDPGTDLGRVAEVGGTPIALGDLKTIVQIEKELARIKEAYFSGKTFTPEQLTELNGLLDQIKGDGISAKLLGAQSTGLTLTVTPDAGNPTDITYNGSTVTLKYQLSLSGTVPSGGTFSLSWKRVLGLMPSDFFNVELALTSSVYNQKKWVSENSAFKFGPNQSDFIINDASQFSGTLTVTLGSSSKKLEDLLGFGLSGSLNSFLEFQGSDGLAFSDGTTQSDSFTLPVVVKKPNAFINGGTWITSVTGVSNHDRGMTNYPDLGYNEYTNPRWDLVDFGNDDMMADYTWMQNTAREIYSGGKPKYQVDARLLLYSSSLPESGYMTRAMPVGYDGSSPSQRLTTVGYWWNGLELDLNSNPLKTLPYDSGGLTLTGTPYVYIGKSASDNSQSVSIVMESQNGNAPLSLNTVWPGNPIFNTKLDGTGSSISLPGNTQQRTVSSSIKVYDGHTAPKLNAVEIPGGTYVSGEYVPITLTFSEPVDASKLTLNINGADTAASALRMDTTGRKAVAMYQVKDADSTTINIANVRGLKDLLGTATNTADNDGYGWNFNDTVTLKSALMKNAVKGISVTPTTLEPQDLSSGVTVTLTLDQAEAYRTKYSAYALAVGDSKAPFQIKLTNQSAGSSQTVQLYLNEPGTTISASGTITGLSPSGTDTVYRASVIAYEDKDDTKGTLLAGQSADFTVKAVAFVNGVSVTYPSGDKTTLSLADTYRPKLGVSFSGNPTYTSGGWQSSNPDIATIDATGQVILAGRAIGTVRFTFTADNGGIADPTSGHSRSATSKEYKVVAGSSPALSVPDEVNRIVVRQHNQAEVRWSSNAKFFPSGDFEYTVDLFKGNFTKDQLEGKTPDYTVHAAKDANSAVLPAEELTELSKGGVPAYTVRISMPHPLITTETLSAVCSIVVNAAPAAVHLTRPSGGLYLLDTQTADIGWSVDNFVDGETSVEFGVTRISTENGSDLTEPVTTQLPSEATGSYTLTPDEVDGLKDTYMVTLRAKNDADEGYSSDSFPLYVYNADALKLEADGQEVTSLTMDNEEKVDGTGGDLPTDTEDILKLREELALIEYVGINYGDYSWSQLKDGIKWATSDSKTVSVNYRQGGLYEDLSRFSMDTYLPETKMALSSVTDGTATITATHANTDMSASVTVDVHTLREKFYLFQLTPAQETELTYTDGKNIEKTVETNGEGVLALYEPDGIASDIRLRATGSDGSVWLGTIYQSRLLSGERDATRLQLYPLNTFKLRQAAKAEIHLKKPDGSPYTGSLTLRGGVYKNDGYCEDAGMLGNTVPDASNPLRDGKDGQTVHVGADGKLTVYMDSTQFWSGEKGEDSGAGSTLSPTDNIQYIFELTDINGYYPLLVYANGNLTLDDLMRSAESVISLESYTGSPRPFISNQTVDYGLSGGRLIDVRHSTGHIGPNETYPEVKLLTTVLLWGEGTASSGYDLQMCDEYGYVPKEQTSQQIKYPFSSIPVVRSTLTLSEETITDSGWIPDGKDAGLRSRLSRGDAMLMELPVSPRVTDLTRVTKLTESTDVTGLLVDLQSDSGTAGAGMSGGDRIINSLMGLMGDMSGPVDGTSFKMIISPGEDNAVFKAFIWAGYNSLGLDDVDYSSSGLFVDTKLAEGELNGAPSLNDLTDMAKGAYDPNKTMSEAKGNEGKVTSSVDFGGQLEGYFEAQIQYNFTERKWEIYVLGGGFTAGFGVGVNFNINAQAGPVPVTASFGVGGSIQLDFKAAARYGEIDGLEWADTVTGNSVNDYLTTLRINAYVNAFGGIGFDYSVLALKIGLFGKLTVDSQNKFLSRTYLKDLSKQQLNGQGLQVAGQVGIKFVAQFLFISYEFVLASVQAGGRWTFNDWTSIGDYWENAGSGIKRSSLAALAGESSLAPVSASATLQSRDYLKEYARSWGAEPAERSPFSILSLDPDEKNALEPLQTNAYPYSLPLVSDNGQLLLYAFDGNSADVSKTRIYATALSGGSYPQGTEIAAPAGFDGYGDSGASLAGSGSFAAAAWVRQSAALPDKDAGDTLSSAEQALLTNGTEIVAAVYDGGGWTAERLTDNAVPDFAPVVATNGSKAIAAWRSVYAGDSEDLLDFSQQDYILYSIYDGSDWSEPKQLYNGTSGAVKGIQAAMLSDGTAAVAYTLDTDSVDGSSSDYEIGYTIVDDAGDPSLSAIVTQDEWLDENPQIAAVQSADGERFVLGWHSVRGGVSDIRLAAVDGDGALSNSFIESIAQAANGSAVNIGGDFRFAKMNETLNDIDNLSILWSESATNDEGETDHGILRAVKFMQDDDGKIGISAPLDVAELPERTLADHFDAYVSETDGKTVKAVIQGTEYKEIDKNDPSTYTVYKDLSGKDVYVAKEETKLFTATATYENRARVDALTADYANLALNTLTPVQFTVFNAGMDRLDSVSIELGSESPAEFDNLDLAPNESKALTCWYPVGDTVENLDYTLNADFDGSAAPEVKGKVYLDYPDVGVSQFKVISEEKGIRTLQLTLYNGSAATLSGNKNRSVRLGFYDDALFQTIQAVACSTPGVTVNSDKTLTIGGEDALSQIDGGAFTLEVSFDVGKYARDKNLDEIPDSGIRLYANAWAEETSGSDTATLPEYSGSNNSASVLFESGLAGGQAVSISLEQGLSGDDKTTADVSLHNNSLRNRTSGNLIVSLLDGDGKVLERQQTYTGDSGSLVTLEGEETASRGFTFGRSGSRVTAVYGDLTLASDNARLSTLSFEGLPVQLSDFAADGVNSYSCTAPNTALNATRVGFVTADPNASATVTANGNTVGGNGSDPITLRRGANTIAISVTAQDGQTTATYTMNVTSQTDKVLESITAPAAVTGLTHGTAKTAQALGLPGSVAISTDCGAESATVSWDVDACSYRPSSTSRQSFTVNGTIRLPFGVSNPNSIPLTVAVSVMVLGKNSSDDEKLGPSSPQQTGSHTYVSDTTRDLTVGGTYQFRITSTDGSVPSFVLGTSGVFSVQMVKGAGNDYFFRVTAVGNPGDRTGVYINGSQRLLVLTVGVPGPSGRAVSDTTGVFDVQEGKKYQFKIISSHRPVLIPGSGSFRLIEVRQVGDEWFFQFIAVGSRGEGCGFYLDGGTTPVAIANIR